MNDRLLELKAVVNFWPGMAVNIYHPSLNQLSFTGLLSLLTAGTALILGATILVSNPRRFANQVFFALLVTYSGTSACVYGAIHVAMLSYGTASVAPLPYLRLNGALTIFFIWLMWLSKDALIHPEWSRATVFRRSLPSFFGCAVFAALCFTHWYIPPLSTTENRIRGPLYFIAAAMIQLTNVIIAWQAWREMRKRTGIRRLELQLFVLNLSVASAISAAFSTLGNLLQIQVLKQAGVGTFFLGCAVSAWTITYHRVFDVRQVCYLIVQRAGVLTVMGLGVIGVWTLMSEFLAPAPSLFLSVAVVGALGFWLDRKSRSKLDLGGERNLARLRRTLIDAALNEPDPDRLAGTLQSLLQAHWETRFAAVLIDRGERFEAGGLRLRKDSAAYAALCENEWSTPESLERRRQTSASAELLRFVIEHDVGVIVTSPRGSKTPSLIIAVGTKRNSWPFTYPEVGQLQNAAELIDNILTRSRLIVEAAAHARAEHLAVMSRGLAHDLKNLITPVSSFLVHTDDQFAAGTPEAEVHADARRSVRIMTDYVREALFFSERLAPHVEPMHFSQVFEAVKEVTASRASRRSVIVSFQNNFAAPIVADAILVQRLLANLVSNAIDASATDQRVLVSAERGGDGWVRLQVADQGCGISAENLDRVFEPYFTTKEFGEDVRGFGLGLTICQKIVAVHGGTITVDSELNRGTVFTVSLPVSSVK